MAAAPTGRIGTQSSHAVTTDAMRVHLDLETTPAGKTCTACLQNERRKAGFFRKSNGSAGASCRCQARLATASSKILLSFPLKFVGAICPVHQAQLRSYLKPSGKSVTLLINFNVVHLKAWHQTFCERHELALKFFVCLRALGG